MNNITTTTTTHSPHPTTATMSPPSTTTRPSPPSQVGPPTSSAASKSWYSAPSAPAPTMIGPSRPKRMPAGRHVMIGGPSSQAATPTAGHHHAPEQQSQQRLNNQHISTARPMNQSMNAMSSNAQATTGSGYGNPSGPARTEKVDMPRA